MIIAQHYNLLGDIDDWIDICDLKPLDELVKQFIERLGRESYYELF